MNRIIPKVANNPEVQEYLDNYRRKSNILIDKRSSALILPLPSSASLALSRRQKTNVPFESSQFWIHELEEKVIDLGSRFRSGNPLNGSGERNHTTTVGISGRNCFPLLIVIEELEELTALALIDNPSFSRGWVAR
jgi:hypothetical protein